MGLRALFILCMCCSSAVLFSLAYPSSVAIFLLYMRLRDSRRWAQGTGFSGGRALIGSLAGGSKAFDLPTVLHALRKGGRNGLTEDLQV